MQKPVWARASLPPCLENSGLALGAPGRKPRVFVLGLHCEAEVRVNLGNIRLEVEKHHERH